MAAKSKLMQSERGIKRKFSNNTELSTKSKHKRARVDPLFQKSVSQINREMSKKLKKESKRNKKGKSYLISLLFHIYMNFNVLNVE
ncbi:UNVERIFIED_CONTAM: hypothetical protein NCL1_57563 [Trichonephila clavipes]